MLRDQRVNVRQPVFSEDPVVNTRRLREQLGKSCNGIWWLKSHWHVCAGIYSFQYKAAANAFGKQRVSLSGKVGGMKGQSSDLSAGTCLIVY